LVFHPVAVAGKLIHKYKKTSIYMGRNNTQNKTKTQTIKQKTNIQNKKTNLKRKI